MKRSSCVELGGFARIEAGGRLVEAEEERLGAHGAGDLEPALGAIGQVAGRVVGALDEVDLLEPVDRLVDRRGLVAVAIAGQRRTGRRSCSPRRRISVLCCATMRFSSTVMPPKRRMFWKVRATSARAGRSR